MAQNSIANKRILVVEDEYFPVEQLCSDLRQAGVDVVGPAPSVETALQLLANEPQLDAAVLDVNLRGQMAYPVADLLLARSVPFVFLTGYSDGLLDKLYPRVLRIDKPSEFKPIAEALAAAITRR